MKVNLLTASRRERERRAWEPIDSDERFSSAAVGFRQTPQTPAENAAADIASLSGPAPCFGALTQSCSAPRRIDVSALFQNSRKKEIYDAWVDFDLLPGFMRDSCDESNSERFEAPWFLKLGDVQVRWEARTTECVPGDRIMWRSPDRVAYRNSGCVAFTAANRTSTRVSVSVEFDGPGSPQITERTMKCIESQLHDTFDFLHTFLGPHALPPTLASA